MGLKQKVMSAMIDRLEARGVPHIVAVEEARTYWKEKHQGVVSVANKHGSLNTVEEHPNARDRRFIERHPELTAFAAFWALMGER